MPSATYSFGATVWPELPICGDLGAHCPGELFGERDVLLRLDAAADGDDALCLAKVDGLLCFAERRLGFLADRRRVDLHVHVLDRRGAALLHGVRAKCADLNGDDCGRTALRFHLRGEFPLKHRPRERRIGAGPVDAGDVGDQRLADARGKQWGEVTRLIRVRQQHERRLRGVDQCTRGSRVRVRRVRLERRVLGDEHFGHRSRRQLLAEAARRCAEHGDADRHAAGELLRSAC
jgi:hypothetical protein